MPDGTSRFSIYVQFDEPGSNVPDPWYRKVVITLVEFLLPRANKSLGRVESRIKYWKVEIVEENGKNFVSRELALDQSRAPLFAAPTNVDYGYWLDTDFDLSDFRERFSAIDISQESFEEDWNRFKNANVD